MKQMIEKHEKCKKKLYSEKQTKKDERECKMQKRKKGKYKKQRTDV